MSNNTFLHDEIYRGGPAAISSLRNCTVLICGVGAIGSNLVNNLARQGVTDLHIVDNDRIDQHNINTQVWNMTDVGAKKAATMAAYVYDITGTDITQWDKTLDERSVKKMCKNVDLVVDCFDNSKSRAVLKKYCEAQNIPCLHVGLYEDYAEVIWNKDYRVPPDSDADICDYPLARNTVLMAVGIASEEVVDFILSDKPRQKNWSFTMKDLCISSGV